MEVYKLKDKTSFSREADFGNFGVISFLQMSDAVSVDQCEHIMKF